MKIYDFEYMKFRLVTGTMRKTMILVVITALIPLVSCREEAPINNRDDKSDSKEFTASIAGMTKNTVDVTDGKVAWQITDEITVTDASSASAVYTIESIDATTGNATFVIKDGETALGGGPYTATYGTEPSSSQTYSETAERLYMTAPATSDNNFTFNVQCGLIRLNLTKAGESIRSIAVTGTPTGKDETTYSLTCNPAESIASAKDFYIALPDGIYTRIVIANTSGLRCTLSDFSVAVEANHIRSVNFGDSWLDFKETALSGEFSVGDARKIRFSKGNLQATYDGSEYTWGFADNQYDYVGDAEGNTTIDNQTRGAVVDLFGWSTDATNFRIDTSEDNADYSGEFVDWGNNIRDGSTWRTLSAEEHIYLFTTRANASDLYRCGVTVCSKTNCLIIAPDGFKGTIETCYDETTWPAAEAVGLVCLPTAGDRKGSNISNVGVIGRYWASSDFCGYGTYAYDVFIRDYVTPGYYDDRHRGCSVRLVTDVK